MNNAMYLFPYLTGKDFRTANFLGMTSQLSLPASLGVSFFSKRNLNLARGPWVVQGCHTDYTAAVGIRDFTKQIFGITTWFFHHNLFSQASH